eukprot:jgi/Hompol1/1133/HPOL_000053-RA
MAWISEKQSIGPAKLRAKFLESLQTERIELKSFETNRTVATFRTLRLDQNLDQVLQPLLNAAEKSPPHTAGAINLAASRNAGFHEETAAANEIEGLVVAETAGGPVRKSHKHAEIKSKLEMRKQQRAERATLWKSLMDEKPDETYEDPKDIAAIRYAQLHMGDYKLKTADNYIVPESERIDADKKRRQILLLRESINTLKDQYNKQVLKLRSRKATLNTAFAKNNARIEEIDTELAALGETVSPTKNTFEIDATAFPENRDYVSPADILQLQKEVQEAASHRSGQDDPMGFGSGTAAPSAPTTNAAQSTAAQSKDTSKPSVTSGKPGAANTMLQAGGSDTNSQNESDDTPAKTVPNLTTFELEVIENKKIL